MSISGASVVRIELIDRGDPVAVDYNQAGLALDGAWHDLDLSAIVPADASWIYLRCTVTDATINRELAFRKDGNANTMAASKIHTQVANQMTEMSVLVPCSTTRVIEYRASAAIAAVGIVILGWIYGS